jgi:hypothetical protein
LNRSRVPRAGSQSNGPGSSLGFLSSQTNPVRPARIRPPRYHHLPPATQGRRRRPPAMSRPAVRDSQHTADQGDANWRARRILRHDYYLSWRCGRGLPRHTSTSRRRCYTGGKSPTSRLRSPPAEVTRTRGSIPRRAKNTPRGRGVTHGGDRWWRHHFSLHHGELGSRWHVLFRPAHPGERRSVWGLIPMGVTHQPRRGMWIRSLLQRNSEIPGCIIPTASLGRGRPTSRSHESMSDQGARAVTGKERGLTTRAHS